MDLTAEKILAYEKRFSKNNYNGSGRKPYVIKRGRTKVMLSLPHAVNHFRNGKTKSAEILTGGIGKYLQEKTGCHLIYSANYSGADPNYDEASDCDYKAELERYIAENDIKVLIDIHGCTTECETAVDMGTLNNEESSLGRFGFINDLFEIVLTEQLKPFLESTGKTIASNKKFAASYANTITNYISRATGIPCMQMEINRMCRDTANPEVLLALVKALEESIGFLEQVDWNAKQIYVFRSKKCSAQFPQDKVEIVQEENICCGDMLILQSREGMVQAIRYEKRTTGLERGCIYLTNRLLEALFGEGEYTDKPVLLYVCEKEPFDIRRPKAGIQETALSSYLCEQIKDKPYEYILYNKYSNSKYYLPVLNYDNLVQKQYGNKQKPGIYMPYYYRTILGAEFPLSEILKESYTDLLDRIKESGEEGCEEDCRVIEESYQPAAGGDYYRIVHENGSDEANRAGEIQKNYIGRHALELVKIPKEEKNKQSLGKRIIDLILAVYIGGNRHDLQVCRPMITDEKNYIVRLSKNVMQLLGVSENDKVDISFGKKTITLKVLENEQSDFVIGLPASARKELGITGINDIVTVERNRKHIFLRNMSQQVFAVLGSVLTVVNLFEDPVTRWVMGILLSPLTVWLVLSEERLRGKK